MTKLTGYQKAELWSECHMAAQRAVQAAGSQQAAEFYRATDELTALADNLRRHEAAVANEEKAKEPNLFVQVEYDLSYVGGNYSGVGEFVLIPYTKGMTESDVRAAFQQKVCIDSCHIIHYTLDELCDNTGKRVEE